VVPGLALKGLRHRQAQETHTLEQPHVVGPGLAVAADRVAEP
jgi:hypothetical protein